MGFFQGQITTLFYHDQKAGVLTYISLKPSKENGCRVTMYQEKKCSIFGGLLAE